MPKIEEEQTILYNRFCVKCKKNLYKSGGKIFYFIYCNNEKCDRFGLYTHIFLIKEGAENTKEA